MGTHDVAIVGAGVIGCAVAHSLARACASVIVLERDEVGAHASRAAAGMLAPIAESSGEGALFQAGLLSLALFPALVEELHELSGVDPEWSRSGILRVASAADEPRLRHRARALAALDCRWLDRDELHKAEPGLAPDLVGALWSEREGHIDARLLTRAYAGAALRRGAQIRSGETVLALLRAGERVIGLRTSREQIAAGEVVLCSGAWAGASSPGLGAALPVRPVKGQMVSLEPEPPVRTRIVWGGETYLVPRRDGTLRVGATVEEAGFDTRPTAAGVQRLLAGALRLVPSLAQARFGESWGGLRPGTPDELPLIGPLGPGLSVATGHYRNGVLLSAITGVAMAERLLSGRATPGFEAFDPARFAAGRVDRPSLRDPE